MEKQKKYFGTDGIRGEVGDPPITADWVLKLGWAAGRVFANQVDHHRPQIVIGKDTRISGYLLESALQAGLISAGADIFLLGPLPTPGIAFLTRELNASAGIVISASHNPFQDNGIKFFSNQGFKITETLEHSIELELDKPFLTVDSKLLGKALRVRDAQLRYVDFCKKTFPKELTLSGLKIILDCANGATYQVAPAIFRSLGAEVEEIGANPDGFNINDHCGSTHPEALVKKVVETQADLGIAFDGDGDRVIMVDHQGEILEGDEILFIITKWYVENKRLKGGVVGTVMSNFGLEEAMNKINVPFVRTAVGDHHVLERIIEKGWNLGGESSGHIICLDCNTTGDGIVSALQTLAASLFLGKSLFELKKEIIKYPQTLINIPVTHLKSYQNLNNNSQKSNHSEAAQTLKKTILESPDLKSAILSAESSLSGKGRILVRPSGTEHLIRVLVEGEEKDLVKKVAEGLAEKIKDF